MIIKFDSAENEANIAKHGISLARAIDLDVLAYVEDRRFVGPRFRCTDQLTDCRTAWLVRSGKASALSRRVERMPRRCVAMSGEQVVFDDENPEWTEEDFARAKRGEDIPPTIAAAFGRRAAGRPRGSDKEQVTLRLDKAALNHFRAAGPGWQTRINEAVRKAAGL